MNELDSLTQPAGPLADITLWGHPYHGLVTAAGSTFSGTGTLARGGGHLMDYQMPRSADAWAIQFDGVPAVVRDSAQAAADALIGYTWLNKVVVSGNGQVWGTDTGSNSPSFYWRDAAGKTWRITLLNTGSSGGLLTEVQVSIRPFGRVGSGAIAARTTTLSHGLSIYSDLWALLGNLLSNDVRPILHDIQSDGSAAIFSISGLQPSIFEINSYNGITEKVVCSWGFFEIALSTGGDGWPVPTLTTLKTNTAALGSWSASQTYSNDGVRVPAGSGERWQGTAYRTTLTTVSGRVMSMMYGSSGVVEVTAAWEVTSEASDTYTVTDLGGGSFDHTNTFSNTETRTLSGSYSGTSFMAASGTVSASGVVDIKPQGDITLPGPAGVPSDFDLRFLSYTLPAGRSVPTTSASVTAIPRAYTARVFGSLTRESGSAGSRTFRYGTVHSPGGTSAGGADETTSAHPSIYRSFNPITGTLSARSDVPVCYV